MTFHLWIHVISFFSALSILVKRKNIQQTTLWNIFHLFIKFQINVKKIALHIIDYKIWVLIVNTYFQKKKKEKNIINMLSAELAKTERKLNSFTATGDNNRLLQTA